MKYEDNGQPYYGQVPKDEARLAAIEWGEGCKSLTNLIEHSIMEGFQTLACCSGHKKGDKAYIMFKSKSKEMEQLIALMFNEEICMEIDFSLNQYFEDFPMVIFRGSYENREEFFSKIDEYILDKDREAKVDQNQLDFIKKIKSVIEKDNLKNYDYVCLFLNTNKYMVQMKKADGRRTCVYYNASEFEINFLSLCEKRQARTEAHKQVVKNIKEKCHKSLVGLYQIQEIPRRLRQCLELGNESKINLNKNKDDEIKK
jgi:hypothetical protein